MRTQAGNQTRASAVTAPDSLRDQLFRSFDKLVAVTAAARPGTVMTSSAASKLALRSLAVRHQGLTAESRRVGYRELGRLTLEVASALPAISPASVQTSLGQLLVAARRQS